MLSAFKGNFAARVAATTAGVTLGDTRYRWLARTSCTNEVGLPLPGETEPGISRERGGIIVKISTPPLLLVTYTVTPVVSYFRQKKTENSDANSRGSTS